MVLAGCNMPSDSPTEEAPPDAVFTAAAETVEAQLSPTFGLSATDIPAQPTSTPLPPTIESVTDTPEPTPTLTPTDMPTPTEIPEIIYFDDFTDTANWYTYDEDEDFGFKYTEAGYHIFNSIRMGVIWSIRDQEYTNVGLEVDGTRIEGPQDSYFGVVCNFSDDGDNYYALVIGDDGFYGLGLMDGGEYEFLASGVDENEVINRGQGETNRIRGVCNGGHFLIYANGELLLDTWDDTLEKGIVGLAVGNKSTNGRSEYRFNDFAITYP
jgi:hypothetical protein